MGQRRLKYIGKYEDVDGRVYKREIRTVKSCPDSILVVTYLGEPDDAEPYFIEVVKLNTKGESKEAQMARGFTAILHNAIQMKKFPQGVAVEGKIVLFEGKPAIITTYTHLVRVVVTH